jgi:methionyl-tRNA formyltransferase
MTPESVLMVGSGSLLVSCLRFLTETEVLPVRCIETGSTAFSSLSAVCRSLQIPYQAFTERSVLNAHLQAVQQPTLVLSIHNIVIFSRECLSNNKLNVVNFHNSLLPRHPGRNAPSWAIYEMDEVTGSTWFEVVPQIDAGGVIAQNSVPLTPTITAIEATKQCVKAGYDSFREILPSLLHGAYSTTKQTGGPYPLHLARHIPNEGILDPHWPVEKMSAFLRALDYGAHGIFDKPRIVHEGNQYVIEKYRLEHDGEDRRALALAREQHEITFTGDKLTIRLALRDVYPSLTTELAESGLQHPL